MPRKRGQRPRRAAAPASGAWARAARARVLASLSVAYLVEVVLLLGMLGAVVLLCLPAADAVLPRPPAPGKSAFTARDHYVGRRGLASAPVAGTESGAAAAVAAWYREADRLHQGWPQVGAAHTEAFRSADDSRGLTGPPQMFNPDRTTVAEVLPGSVAMGPERTLCSSIKDCK